MCTGRVGMNGAATEWTLKGFRSTSIRHYKMPDTLCRGLRCWPQPSEPHGWELVSAGSKNFTSAGSPIALGRMATDDNLKIGILIPRC